MKNILSFPTDSGKATPMAPPNPTLSEVWGGTADGGVLGFAMSMIRADQGQTRPYVLWVQDRVSALEFGQPYAPALGVDILYIHTSREADALAAMEMGLGCSVLSAVVGELWGDAPKADFTATKRLAMRAEHTGVPCWLLRRGANPGLSAARERWQVTSLPSLPNAWNATAPGPLQWQAHLFRSRSQSPGKWVVSHDGGAQDRLRFSAASGDGSVDHYAIKDAERPAR